MKIRRYEYLYFMFYECGYPTEELKSMLIERGYILETSRILTPESFPNELFESEASIPAPSLNCAVTLEAYRSEATENAVRHYLKQVLARNKGKIKDTADVAGISTRQLHKLMKKYGLRKEEFKKQLN